MVTFSKLVMYHSLFLMFFFHYHHDYGRTLPLESPLQFGNLSVYHTRTKSCFAGVVCHLHFFFRHRAAQYWNDDHAMIHPQTSVVMQPDI